MIEYTLYNAMPFVILIGFIIGWRISKTNQVKYKKRVIKGKYKIIHGNGLGKHTYLGKNIITNKYELIECSEDVTSGDIIEIDETRREVI